jgi:hypothetical protein
MDTPTSIKDTMLITKEFKLKHVELTEQIVTLTEKAARLERKNEVLKGLLIKYVHRVHKDDTVALNETLLQIENM